MKLNSAISKFLTNKLVLHIISFLALFNVIGHMIIGHYNIVFYFIIIALLVRYFSKNMIVVLGVPLILVNLMSLKMNSYTEGLENQTDSTENTEDKKVDDSDKDATGEKKIAPSNEKKTKTEDNTNEESFEVGRAKKSGHSIDYATTIEDAYDQLNSILGKDGIKSLTADTERLMQQQTQLAGSLKDMGPLIEKMGPMMEGVENMMKNMPDIAKGDVMNKVQSMLSNLKKKET
jgi:hypothetical protein